LVEEEAQKDFSSEIRTLTPVSVATFMLNEKRKEISEIEKRHNIKVVVIPHESLETPHFEVQRIRKQDDVNTEYSYKLTDTISEDLVAQEQDHVKPVPPAQQPAVKALAQTQPAPTPSAKSQQKKTANNDQKPGLLRRLFNSLFGEKKQPETKAKNDSQSRGRNNRRPQNRNRRPDDRSDNRRNGRGRGKQNQNRDNRDNRNRNSNNPQQDREASKAKDQQQGKQSRSDQTPTKAGQTSAKGSDNNTNRPPRREGDKRRNPRQRRQRQDVPEELRTANATNADQPSGVPETAATVAAVATAPTASASAVDSPVTDSPVTNSPIVDTPVAPAANEKSALEQETTLAPEIAETPANTDATASTPADITTPNTEVPVETITTAPVKEASVEKSAALGQESVPNKNVVTEAAEQTSPIVTKTVAEETTPPQQPVTSETK
jgi:ribonuclease E